ncbi:MAG: TIGR01620 family protein [Xanthobacteraceae bacterium]
MTKTWRHRPPAVFRLDDDHVIVGTLKETGSSRQPVQVKPEPEFDALAITVDEAGRSSRRGLHWGTLFWCALGGLILLAVGVRVTDLIVDLLERNRELGGLALALAILAAVSLVVIAIRETAGLMRLATVEKLRHRAADMIARDDRVEARALVHELLGLTRRMPRLARSRANLESHLGDIIDGADMVRLAERELMTPLDQQARTLVSAAATRVSVVTALNPRAIIDVLFVLASAMFLVRRLALLYGVRPGTLGFGRLVRLVVVHLAMTGGLATSDNLIQQMLGHGIAAKLSARLGEGLLNGLLTARFGLAAIDVIRPMPFVALPRPTLRDLMNEVLRGFGDSEDRQRSAEASLSITEVP